MPRAVDGFIKALSKLAFAVCVPAKDKCVLNASRDDKDDDETNAEEGVVRGWLPNRLRASALHDP